jgi:amino acid adenylation domain-containing protein
LSKPTITIERATRGKGANVADSGLTQPQETLMPGQESFRGLIHGFRESVCRFPDRTALFVDGESLSYADLGRLVQRVSRAILEDQQRTSPLAAVWAARSVTAYVGVLACLAAGKGYVPLNPKFPLARTHRMLCLSGCTVMIVGKECLPQLPHLLQVVGHPLTIILPEVTRLNGLESDYPLHRFVVGQELPGVDSSLASVEVNPAATAYLLFTSGSTGEPKGVPISQGNVRSYLEWIGNHYEVNERDRVSQEFDLTFDLSVHDMFVCWEHGASLYCVPERSVMAPAKFIREHQLTMWFSVPSVAGLLAKMRLLSPGSLPSLRCSLFCGEPLPAAYAQAWQEAAPNSIVANLYGPTETTIAITHYRWEGQRSLRECLNGIVPIGRVFDSQDFRVTDGQGNVVPAGEAGELCLSGTQVAAGYWNNPEKTRERFVRLPGTRNRVWYRTGDLVRQDAAGNLCYLGRIDDQIKIRGYRVELQEIESVLRRACGTGQAVAVPWPVSHGSAEGIVAFVAGVDTLDQGHVRSYCNDLLPDYMVPKNIYVIEELPLNQNQKIDRRKLVELLEGADT